MKKWIGHLSLYAIGAAALSAGLPPGAQAKPDDPILEGVYAGDISLSGMTRGRGEGRHTVLWIHWPPPITITLNGVEGNTVEFNRLRAWTWLGEPGAC